LKIGVISDTHNFFDPQIPSFFKGVDHILHGGDIGQPKILFELEKMAPVTAVLGNTDDPGFGYRLTEVVELGGFKFLVHHIVDPHTPDEGLQEVLTRSRPDVVVFGHTHKPFAEKQGGVLFFNPGYAGKSRFGMPRTIAIVHCDEHGSELRHEYFQL